MREVIDRAARTAWDTAARTFSRWPSDTAAANRSAERDSAVLAGRAVGVLAGPVTGSVRQTPGALVEVVPLTLIRPRRELCRGVAEWTIPSGRVPRLGVVRQTRDDRGVACSQVPVR